MNLLIISHHQDNHAAIVALAVSELGHSVTLWAGPATSAATTASVRMDNRTQSWCLGGKQYDADHFDTVWYRRRLPVALPEGIHPADLRFADTEVQEFYDDLWTIAAPATRWIHSPQATLTGEWKMRQLSIAKSLGLHIPSTLVSNDRAAILDFISRVEGEGGQVVYKTFSPMSWGENGRSRTMYTAPVTSEQIHASPFIDAVPGIYQKRIQKAYEIRANFFGGEELSARIESTSLTYGEEDWRAEVDLKDFLSPMSLPETIREKCSEMLKSMSFDMACFDFIVDQQGDHYFLELNHQGQFLWVEDECPEIPMLDTFVRFATGDDAASGAPLVLSRFMDSEAHRQIAAEFSKTRHVELSGKRA